MRMIQHLKAGLRIDQLESSTIEAEEEYFEEKRAPDPMIPKGAFRKLAKIVLERPEKIQDIHLTMIPEAASKSIETAALVMEGRIKILKSLKGFLLELSAQNDQLGKHMQRLAKSHVVQPGSSAYLKRISDDVDIYYNAIELLGKKYINLSNFINIKIATLDAVIKELSSASKNYQNNSQKVVRDYQQTRQSYLSGLAGLEKASKRLTDAEKDKKEGKLTMAKLEVEESQGFTQELQGTLKASVSEVVVSLRKALNEYREFEFTRIKGAIGTFEVIVVHQQNTTAELKEFSRNIGDISKTEGEALNAQVDSLLEQDDKVESCLKMTRSNLNDVGFTFVDQFQPPG